MLDSQSRWQWSEMKKRQFSMSMIGTILYQKLCTFWALILISLGLTLKKVKQLLWIANDLEIGVFVWLSIVYSFHNTSELTWCWIVSWFLYILINIFIHIIIVDCLSEVHNLIPASLCLYPINSKFNNSNSNTLTWTHWGSCTDHTGNVLLQCLPK